MIIRGTTIALGISVLVLNSLSLKAGDEAMTVRELNDSNLVSTEECLAEPTMSDFGIGAATARIPSKAAFFRDLQLLVARPEGARLEADLKTNEAVLKELRQCFGENLISPELAPFIEVYDHLLSKDQIERWRQGNVRIATSQGAVYFIPFRKGPYRVQILGELGSYACVFVYVPLPALTLDELWPKLLPEIDLAKLEVRHDRFSPGICDHHLHGQGLQVRTGRRTAAGTEFYGLRVDADIEKLTVEEPAATAPAR